MPLPVVSAFVIAPTPVIPEEMVKLKLFVSIVLLELDVLTARLLERVKEAPIWSVPPEKLKAPLVFPNAESAEIKRVPAESVVPPV